jgi:pimeloyl-ACP methyl ester carboxylesterase
MMTPRMSPPAPPARADPPYPLSEGIRSRLIDNGNGLSMHVLEAGWAPAGQPALLLLHGFPELAYSWRTLMPLLAQAGYHVLAPDQRGFGRTRGVDTDYDAGLAPFYTQNLVRDAFGLLHALEIQTVAAVIGHDFGSPVAAWCALLRPDVFTRVALMSAPFAGPPAVTAGASRGGMQALERALAQLDPPRKHYQSYYTTRAADADMRDCPQGLHAFLRAYYHLKSADGAVDVPHELARHSTAAYALLPTYYVMPLHDTMAQTVARGAPSAAQVAACTWLTERSLEVYVREFAHTGFQGGLNWYRSSLDAGNIAQLQLFAGRRIEVPATFIGGRFDWGVYQAPGALETMATSACTRFRGPTLIDAAGHWVQQEQPAETARVLLDFIGAPPA